MNKDKQFIKDLEKRSMSSWTSDEISEYSRITGQYENADVNGMQYRIDRLEAMLATCIDTLEVMAMVYLSKQGCVHRGAEQTIREAKQLL